MKKMLQYFALGLLPGLGFADEGLSAEYSVCMDKTGGVSASILECMVAEYAAQDARLNRAYLAAKKELASERAKQLQQVQRLWIKYRQANCHFYADPKTEVSARLRAQECLMNITTARATELENLKLIQTK